MSKFKTLSTRAGTATIFAAVMLAGIYIHPASLVLLFGMILVIGLKELFELLFSNDPESLKKYRIMGILVCLIPFCLILLVKARLIQTPDNHYVWITMFLFPVFIAFLIELLGNGMQKFYRVSCVALGLAYLVLPVSLVCDLAVNESGFHPNIIMGLLCLIWVNDSGAYFAGSAFGRTKLNVIISPGKSWEGSLGGAILTLLVAWFFPHIFGEFTAGQWMILGIIAIVFGTLGDLTESMLKRNQGVKDSGSLMPGHGGILDRFDAFIFLIPFAYLYIRIFIG